MISAEIICDSVSPTGHRITTFKLRYPKFIHGEFMTHRMFSRNASSSRAVPTAKLLEEVRTEARAAPVFWGKNQPGMSAAVELSDMEGHPDGPRSERFQAQRVWTAAAFDAAKHAEELMKVGAHKQIVNRLLEPFSHINVVVTATEWDNFFGLRLHYMAQPEMRALAEAMWTVRKASAPALLSPGKWHLPFVDGGVHNEVAEAVYDPTVTDAKNNAEFDRLCIKVSVARCARVSYESFETGKRSTIEEDLGVYARLNLPGSETYDPTQPIHASPAEHQATPGARSYQWGNFSGWRQYRKMLPGEAVAPLPESY